MDYLTKEQIEYLKSKLLEQKKKILESLRQLQEEQQEGYEQTPGDEIDISTEMIFRQTEERLRRRELGLLRKIEKALQRMEDGSYGYCEECGDEIGFPRLKARPVAELCIDCKEEQERREKQEYEPEEGGTFILNDRS